MKQMYLPTLVLILGVFAGLLVPILPIKLTIILFGGLAGLLLSIKYPVTPLFLAVFIVCDIVPFDKGGRLYVAFLMACICLSITISYLKKHQLNFTSKGLFLPAILFIFAWIIGLINGKYFSGNYFPYIWSEFQVILLWLIYPALLFSFNKKQPFESIQNFLIFTAIVVASVSILQNITGISLAGARVEELETLGQIQSDVTRTTIAGKLFILFALFALSNRLLLEKLPISRTLFNALIIGLLTIALIMSFGRALWAAALIGLLMTSMLLGKKQLLVITVFLVVFGSLGFVGLNILKPAVAEAVNNRVVSVFSEGKASSSYGWRLSENSFADLAIAKKPVMGIGLGGEYKPPLVNPKFFPNQTTYIHNGYRFLALKLGLWSLILPIFMIGTITVYGVRTINRTTNLPIKSAAASVISCYWAVSLLAFTQPEWSTASSIVFFATSFSLIASAEMKNSNLD